MYSVQWHRRRGIDCGVMGNYVHSARRPSLAWNQLGKPLQRSEQLGKPLQRAEIDFSVTNCASITKIEFIHLRRKANRWRRVKKRHHNNQHPTPEDGSEHFWPRFEQGLRSIGNLCKRSAPVFPPREEPSGNPQNGRRTASDDAARAEGWQRWEDPRLA